MKLVLVIQARTASTRLPGKVLLPVGGRPLLALMLERVALAREPDEVVVATTHDPSDDPIVELCAGLSVRCVRGHPLDCLDRHLQAGRACEADAVVKIPSDCPLIDPRVIDLVLVRYRETSDRHDYVSNLHPTSWPDGNDVEVMSMAALELAAGEAHDPFDREHTTPFLWSKPERFRLGNVCWDRAERDRGVVDYAQRYRWVVDWPEDLTVVRAVAAELEPNRGVDFGVQDILDLYARRPELEGINAEHRGYHYTQTRSTAARGATPSRTQPWRTASH